MARNTTRVGRRRRVLNEEVLSASNIAIHKGRGAEEFEPGDTPRYGAGANIENHPQVTSFVPRRFRMFLVFALLGVGAAATAELVAYFAQPLSANIQVVSAAEITEVFANRLVAWTSATLLLLSIGYTRLIFSLRRHRVDDERGRYRVWRTAGWAAALLSANSVLGAHTLVARVLGSQVEWQLLPTSTGWWLFPAAAIGGWLLIKLMIEASECRSALSLFIVGVGSLIVAGIASAGWSPAWAAAAPELMTRTLPLIGFTSLLLATQSFARYVILDVQGLIEHKAVEPKAEVETKKNSAPKPVQVAEETVDEPVQEEYEAEVSESSNWVDGSEPEESYDDEPSRKLSKAERKRLRKQKQRNRAA